MNKALEKRQERIRAFWGEDFKKLEKILATTNKEFNNQHNSYLSYSVGISL